MSSLFLRLAPAIALVYALPAAAADQAAQAERVRLQEEMRRLAGKSTWRGVDAAYVKMLALEKNDVVLDYEDHFMGAEAARELGRITDVYDRLLRARARKKVDACEAWIAEIESAYGRVDLSRDDRYTGEAALTPSEMPFDPAQRNAIGAAQLALQNNLEYKGLIPFGKYTFGGHSFDIGPGGAVVTHYLSTSGGGASGKRRDGLRVTLGPQWAAAGAPKESPSGGDVSAGAFGGAGLRAGVGFEVQLGKSPVGLMAETGYHGMFPRVDKDDAGVIPDQIGETKSKLNAFYLWGGATWAKDDLAISAGPSWFVGGSSALGEDAAGNPTAVQGTVKAGGGTVGVFYGLFDTPGMSRSRSGVSLIGGAHTDLQRTFPWVQLAFTVSPSI
jgi:hypothetical protein